jgi:hypothetical protein
VIDVSSIIPSKKIYSVSSEKVLNNQFNSVSITTQKLTKTEATSKDYSVSEADDTTKATGYSEYATNVSGSLFYRDVISVQFAKSSFEFSSDQLVDFSNLEVEYKFDVGVTGGITWDELLNLNYSVYAINSAPSEAISSVPPPDGSKIGKITGRTASFIKKLFRENVYYEISNIQPTSADITIYFVGKITIDRKTFSTDLNELSTTQSVISTNSRTASVIASYKNEEQFTVEYGDGSKVFDYPQSDLLRFNTPFMDGTLDAHHALKVLEDYANGKETATIVCEIGEYDFVSDNGEVKKKISQIGSENNSVFQIGDTVCPMVKGANGQDRPLSYHSDKTPKKFFISPYDSFPCGLPQGFLWLQEQRSPGRPLLLEMASQKCYNTIFRVINLIIIKYIRREMTSFIKDKLLKPVSER